MTTTIDTQPFGALYDYDTAEYLRPATDEEQQASRTAAQYDGGAGVIEVGGVSCYVID